MKKTIQQKAIAVTLLYSLDSAYNKHGSDIRNIKSR